LYTVYNQLSMGLDEINVPEQKKGARSDTRYSVRASNEQAARKLFQNARLNLLNVNGWHTLSGDGVVFQLMNEKGEEIQALAFTGNYFRICIPGIPGSASAKSEEWVYVEKIEEGTLKYHEFLTMRVRPCANPLSGNHETAHFFSSDATSTFSVIRNGTRVQVSVSGRNETPNTETSSLFSRVRNVIVAFGAMLGLNKPLWKSLAKGIIKKKGAVLRTQ
jgi:hypothetical protein